MILLNVLSKVLLGVGIVDCWKQASKSKTAAQKAEQLARDKHLREAAQIVEKSLAAVFPASILGAFDSFLAIG